MAQVSIAIGFTINCCRVGIWSLVYEIKATRRLLGAVLLHCFYIVFPDIVPTVGGTGIPGQLGESEKESQ